MKIFLDAVLEKQIGTVTFRGKLANGHQFSAYLPQSSLLKDSLLQDSLPKNRQNERTSPCPGMTVRVALSPFDMSKGAIESWQACPTSVK